MSPSTCSPSAPHSHPGHLDLAIFCAAPHFHSLFSWLLDSHGVLSSLAQNVDIGPKRSQQIPFLWCECWVHRLKDGERLHTFQRQCPRMKGWMLPAASRPRATLIHVLFLFLVLHLLVHYVGFSLSLPYITFVLKLAKLSLCCLQPNNHGSSSDPYLKIF